MIKKYIFFFSLIFVHFILKRKDSHTTYVLHDSRLCPILHVYKILQFHNTFLTTLPSNILNSSIPTAPHLNFPTSRPHSPFKGLSLRTPHPPPLLRQNGKRASEEAEARGAAAAAAAVIFRARKKVERRNEEESAEPADIYPLSLSLSLSCGATRLPAALARCTSIRGGFPEPRSAKRK